MCAQSLNAGTSWENNELEDNPSIHHPV